MYGRITRSLCTKYKDFFTLYRFRRKINTHVLMHILYSTLTYQEERLLIVQRILFFLILKSPFLTSQLTVSSFNNKNVHIALIKHQLVALVHKIPIWCFMQLWWYRKMQGKKLIFLFQTFLFLDKVRQRKLFINLIETKCF